MCRQEPGANPADRRERGSHILRAFCRLLLLHLHHLLVILTGPSLGTVKNVFAKHKFCVEIAIISLICPALGPAPVPPPTKVPYFAFRRVRSRNPRIDSPIPSPPPCDPSPYPTYKQPNEQQKPRWNNAWRENTKHITFDCCLLFWLPFMPLAYTERNRFVCG